MIGIHEFPFKIANNFINDSCKFNILQTRAQKVLTMSASFTEELTPDAAELLKKLWADKGMQVIAPLSWFIK